MGGGISFGHSRNLIAALSFVALFAAGCNETKQTDTGVFDASRLPRVSGAKEVFASPATTIFTSPDPVAQTAETVDKALAAAGWQKYVAPNTATTNDPSMRTMSLKKGAQALSVFISVAPAQNNATSVQYSAVPLKTDLPFAKDATNIEFDPNRPQLSLLTADTPDNTLNFYRKEMSALGWSMWSEKTNGKQAADGPSGVVHDRGAYAHYVNDREPATTLVLTLQKADAGKLKLEIKGAPIGILASLHESYLNSDNFNTPAVDVSRLPRLDGAIEDGSRSSADRLVYSVPGPVPSTVTATEALLAKDGWKEYAAPLDPQQTLLAFKKGRQGLSVSFTMTAGQPGQSSVYYSPIRLRFTLPIPDDATDVVYDDNRPYLNAVSAGTIDATLDFYRKALAASDWVPLSSADAAAQWPGAKFDEKSGNVTPAYFIRGNRRPLLLTLQALDGGNTNVELKVPPFARPQDLEADQDIFELPKPKVIKSAGGTGGSVQREMHATVPAELPVVLAFYRRQLAARNWTEDATAAVVAAKDAILRYSSAEGTAVLKLGYRYDLTTVSLVQQLKPAPKPEAKSADKDDSLDALLKQAQQMIREAGVDAKNAGVSPPAPSSGGGAAEPLRPLVGNTAPIPVPDTAAGIEFDGADGKLEFSSASSVRSLAAFYRASMKPLGWRETPSVINNPNMAVLNFNKGASQIAFTIMQMGPKANVSADGSGLRTAAAKVEKPSQPATAEDLEAEESGGLPVPKRHTLAVGDKTPFRRELNANVPLDLEAVLGFYRRELGKLNWKESPVRPATVDAVELAYVTPDGPGKLTLGRKDNETVVKLSAKDPGAASRAGILPKAGQGKVLFGNILPTEGTVTFNNKPVNVAAGAGTKEPDGPSFDLPPGKYRYTIKPAGKPAQSEELDLGADETWGLMIGPGGVLALQAY